MQLGEKITVAPCYRGIADLLPLEVLSAVQQPMFSKSQPFCIDIERLQLVGQARRIGRRAPSPLQGSLMEEGQPSIIQLND